MSMRNTILVAAVVCACATGGARADDFPVSPVYSNAPAALAGGPCPSQPSCGGVGGVWRYTAGCRGVPTCPSGSCETSRFQKQKEPYVVTLCPGACFGYFRTQWRTWDEACGSPYPGTIGFDPMKPPAPLLPPSSDRPAPDVKKNGDAVPPPRPVDPKGSLPLPPPGVGVLPAIPPYPYPRRGSDY